MQPDEGTQITWCYGNMQRGWRMRVAHLQHLWLISECLGLFLCQTSIWQQWGSVCKMKHRQIIINSSEFWQQISASLGTRAADWAWFLYLAFKNKVQFNYVLFIKFTSSKIVFFCIKYFMSQGQTWWSLNNFIVKQIDLLTASYC